jgi:ribonuclease BN (tRNA processing enzyme)
VKTRLILLGTGGGPRPRAASSASAQVVVANDTAYVVGDTLPCNNLIRLAEGADVLVHDALYVPALDRLAARVPNAPALKRSILSHHTPVEEAGRVARAAGVKKLVLSHLIPADDS